MLLQKLCNEMGVTLSKQLNSESKELQNVSKLSLTDMAIATTTTPIK